MGQKAIDIAIEVQKFRGSEVQRFRSSEVQKFRSSEDQKFRSSEVQTFRTSELQIYIECSAQSTPFSFIMDSMSLFCYLFVLLTIFLQLCAVYGQFVLVNIHRES